MNYKIVFIPVFGGDGKFEMGFEKEKDARIALAAVANYTLFLHECSLMPDYSNVGMVLRHEGDDWVDVEEL